MIPTYSRQGGKPCGNLKGLIMKQAGTLWLLVFLTLRTVGAQSGVSVYAASAANASSLEPTVTKFRSDLGDLNPNEARSLPAGRREINWDAVGGTQGNNNLPGDFFHINSPRGLIMSTPGQRLKVSGDNGTDSFLMKDVTRDQWGLIEFGAFSGDKFFAPMGSPVTDIEFRIPGSSQVGCVAGFGAVFMDVDRGGQSFIEFGLSDGTVRKINAPLSGARSKGLSFVGARFTDTCILSVRIQAGDRPVDNPDIPVPLPDGVGLDDFIYSEPKAIPVPAGGPY